MKTICWTALAIIAIFIAFGMPGRYRVTYGTFGNDPVVIKIDTVTGRSWVLMEHNRWLKETMWHPIPNQEPNPSGLDLPFDYKFPTPITPVEPTP